jgi:hypothetical protein
MEFNFRRRWQEKVGFIGVRRNEYMSVEREREKEMTFPSY